MYTKRFTFDLALIERARVVTLRSPNLNVLREENRAEMPGIAHFLEDGFKARDKQGKLLLPDLSALLNSSVGIYSDYGIPPKFRTSTTAGYAAFLSIDSNSFGGR